MVLDVLGVVVAEAGFLGTEDALAVALVVVGAAPAFAVGGTTLAGGAFAVGGTTFAAGAFAVGGITFAAGAFAAGGAALEVVAAGVLVAVPVVAFTGAVVLGVVLGPAGTAEALFGLVAATAGDFAVPASAVFGAVVAPGLPLGAVVMALGKMGTDLEGAGIAVDPVVCGMGFNMRDWVGTAATLVAVFTGGAALGPCEILVVGVTGGILGGSVLALAAAVAVAVAAAAGGRDQFTAELGCLSSTTTSGVSIMEYDGWVSGTGLAIDSAAEASVGAVSLMPPMGGRALAILGPVSCQEFCRIESECVNSLR